MGASRRAIVVAVLLTAAFVGTPAAQAQAPAYEIPPDNPFVGTSGARAEIYVYGMRNPFRWSFDRQTGDVLIGDVGGDQREEIDFLPHGSIAGANLGWNCREGDISRVDDPPCTLPGAVEPSYWYDHSGTGRAIIGGYVVRDPSLPTWQGRYLFGDNSDSRVRWLGAGAAPPTPGTAGDTGLDVAGLTGFGEDGVGHLYATAYGGEVYRLGEDAGTLTKTSIGPMFSIPMAVAAPPGDADRLFVAEREGSLKLLVGGVVHDFLSVQTTTASERGLLAVAVAPSYAGTGKVYVYYTDASGNLQLDEFTRSATDATKADPASRRPIITIPHPDASNHNGGQLLFGSDGYLYLSTGDGGTQGDPENDAQRLDSLLGKIIRIDPDVTPGPPAKPPSDVTAPTLQTRVAKRQRVLRLRGAVAHGRCDEACTVSVAARLKIGKRFYKLHGARATGAADQRVTLKAKLTKRATRALRKALRHGKHPKVGISLRARDTAGNPTRLVHATVRVRR